MFKRNTACNHFCEVRCDIFPPQRIQHVLQLYLLKKMKASYNIHCLY